MTSKEYRDQPQSYRRGYVEGRCEGERDAYLLYTGANDISEYERGFADGVQSRAELECENV